LWQIRIVSPSDWDFFLGGGTLLINFVSFLIITTLNVFVSIKSDTFITLHRTHFSTDTSSCSCILHIKVCFVRSEPNCATLPQLISYLLTYLLTYSLTYLPPCLSTLLILSYRQALREKVKVKG
jgi:hypothetical protein